MAELRRQDAHDVGDADCAAHSTVPNEVDDDHQLHHSQSVPLVLPRTISAKSYHRRELSSDDSRKASSISVPTPSTLSSIESRKKLSESRNVNLTSIQLSSQLKQADTYKYLQYNQVSQTPISKVVNSISEAPLSANSQQKEYTFCVHYNVPELEVKKRFAGKDQEPPMDTRFKSVDVMILGGKVARASFLLEEVLKCTLEKGTPLDDFQTCFALWIESPLLEVQLKSHHSPYQVMDSWDKLLKRYASECEEMYLDVPTITVRRKVQLSIKTEKEIIERNKLILELLFNEAYECFMEGRYCMKVEEAVALSGVALNALYQPYNHTCHTIEFIRQNMDSMVPIHFASTVRGPVLFGKALSKPNSLEELLISSWQKAPHDVHEARKRFIFEMHKQPFYGSAFFPATIEKPKKKWTISGGASDIQVLVGVNQSTITLLDSSKHEIILMQNLKDCNWKLPPVTDEQRMDGMEESIFLQFPACNGSKKSNMLQMFTPQAVMMKALLSSMRQISNSTENSDDSGAELSDTPSPPLSANSCSAHVPVLRTNSMCLATFNADGACVKVQGSLKTVLGGKMVKV